MERPKGASAAIAKGVLMVKILYSKQLSVYSILDR